MPVLFSSLSLARDTVRRRNGAQCLASHGGRWLIAVAIAAAVSWLLSLLMLWLVDAGDSTAYVDRYSSLRMLDVVRTRQTPQAAPKQRNLPPRPPLVELPHLVSVSPTLPPLRFDMQSEVPALAPQSYLPPLGWKAAMDSLVEIGEFRALSRVDPVYPPFAERQGIEGWVRVAFTVTEGGSVVDARVVDADPRRVFEQAALAAISRWRYQPQAIDGRRVRRQGVEVTFEFRLVDSPGANPIGSAP